jgi:hypothetical protein
MCNRDVVPVSLLWQPLHVAKPKWWRAFAEMPGFVQKCAFAPRPERDAPPRSAGGITWPECSMAVAFEKRKSFSGAPPFSPFAGVCVIAEDASRHDSPAPQGRTN